MEKGKRKEELNWIMRLFTLGDRFDLRDFYDRLKKSTVEFAVIFFGILMSFGVEQQWGKSEEREDSIENLNNLKNEIEEMIAYTDGYKENIILAYELFTEQYYRWEEKNENIFIQYYQDSSYVIPFELYSNRNPFNPPRVTYDAIKLDGTFRLLDDSVGRLMTDIYDGTNLKYLIENSSVEEQKFIDQFNERVNYKWIYDLDYISLGSEDFWKENWKYVQKDKFLKYNLYRRLQMWDTSLFVQLDDYKNQLMKGEKVLDSVIAVRESEIEIIYWVINKKD
tara:strand:+ start:5885 stop:6724 length:840 start_codon:yes stop_codon:yes gene_type:complete